VVAFKVEEGAMKSNRGFSSTRSPLGTCLAPLHPQSSPRTFPSEAVVRDITVRGKPWRGVTSRVGAITTEQRANGSPMRPTLLLRLHHIWRWPYAPLIIVWRMFGRWKWGLWSDVRDRVGVGKERAGCELESNDCSASLPLPVALTTAFHREFRI
jgi:hypothetical protein